MSPDRMPPRRAFTDDEIEALAAADAQLPPLTDAELASAVAVAPAGRVKVPISIRLDEEVLAALKEEGPRYQTRINEILLAYVRGEFWPLPQDVAEHYRIGESGGLSRLVRALRDGMRPPSASAPARRRGRA
jgi:uncharacterized protein (DUF4415 family)